MVPGETAFEAIPSKTADVEGMPVLRSLPAHGHRTVGAWCFMDRFGPTEVDAQRDMTVGPHPHIGLHTVTWLISGEVLHTDSLGSEQLIRPGQLNLMTAGGGIAHAEDSRGQQRGQLDGVQLWVAQTDGTRGGPPAFAHHEDLPVVDLGRGEATVLLGQFGEMRSPAEVDSALAGVVITGEGTIEVPLRPDFEYGLSVLSGAALIGGEPVPPAMFAYLGAGRSELSINLAAGSRILLLGGEPFGQEIAMWWNFVARNRDELEEAYRDWTAQDERFGKVASTLERIPAPRPFWMDRSG